MQQIQYYVLFPNHDNAMRLYQVLRKEGISAKISPTPRAASKCCGVSLMIEEADVERIEGIAVENEIEILKTVGLEKDVNPRRDRYC